MSEFQFRQVPAELAAVKTRNVPLKHFLISATGASTDTFFTVRDNVAFEVKKFVALNTDTSALGMSLYTTPNGVAAGMGNAELYGVAIPAGTAVDFTDLLGGLYEGGTEFKIVASATNLIVVHGWGVEHL